jgi:dynein heavy chain
MPVLCALQAARLWIHEVERVFRDRMVNTTDMAKFDEFKTGITKKYFEDLGMPALEQSPLLFTSFMHVCCEITLQC